MDEKDQKYVQSVKDDYSGRNMTVQAPEQRLLDIIARLEAENESLEKQLTNSIPVVRNYKGEPTHVDETDWMEL